MSTNISRNKEPALDEGRGEGGECECMIFSGQLIELKRVKSMTKKQLVSTSFGRDGRCYGPVKVL